ncbi:Aste57867_17449 [Aphanomyces stellatus]|uniref:Aste57867_17449 protein n=1 Tax=Aphanomyces stellatus TaxID=120398 RepID=A0A485LBE5_9STRA|nr:hypothetical protein As57867_017389 [Aphanomyces stellatus]VFT94203.1 Aste57867_17449 [Aphanomyces stellatus]
MDTPPPPQLPNDTSMGFNTSPSDFALFQPDYCDTPKATKPNARPFTASASTDNLFACVHFAVNMHVLVGHGAAAGPPPTLFVVLRVGRVLEPTNKSEFWSSPPGEKHTYTTSYTQFAATRAVDATSPASPCCFNELVVVNVPHQASAMPPGWGLRLDVVLQKKTARDADDLLLAYAALPLAALAPETERSFCIRWPVTSNESQPSMPTLYVTLFRQKREASTISAAPWQRLEITLDTATAPHAAFRPDATLAIVQLLPAAATTPPVVLGASLPFLSIQSDSDVSTAPAMPTSALLPDECRMRVTPGGAPDSTGVYSWRYPMLFDFHNPTAIGPPFNVHVALFASTTTFEYACIGSSVCQAMGPSSEVGQREPWSTDLTVRMASPPTEISLRGSIRWWAHATWQDFRKERVVCTNRHGSASRQGVRQQNWMAAISRGLNRHPISAVVDAGGIAGVIASMFQQTSEKEVPPSTPPVSTWPMFTDKRLERAQPSPQGPPRSSTIDETLRTQLQCLAQELSTKQALVDKMQKEMDKRTNAIKSCGVEIVDLRKSLQKKDQQIQTLQMKLNNYELLEQRQQEEIRLCLDGHGLNATSFPILAQQYTKLQTKHNELDASHALLSRKILEARNFEAELLELKMQHRKLEDAHVAQATFIQKANAETQKLGVYKQTIATQETVIGKLEKLVESKLADTKATAIGPNVHAEIFRLRLENAYLKEQSTLHLSTGRLQGLQVPTPKTITNGAVPALNLAPVHPLDTLSKPNSLRPLQNLPSSKRMSDQSTNQYQPSAMTHQPSSESRRKLMVDKSTATDPPPPQTQGDSARRATAPPQLDDNILSLKIRVLEDQLRINATAAAQEIAELKSRLFEYEMGSVW